MDTTQGGTVSSTENDKTEVVITLVAIGKLHHATSGQRRTWSGDRKLEIVLRVLPAQFDIDLKYLDFYRTHDVFDSLPEIGDATGWQFLIAGTIDDLQSDVDNIMNGTVNPAIGTLHCKLSEPPTVKPNAWGGKTTKYMVVAYYDYAGKLVARGTATAPTLTVDDAPPAGTPAQTTPSGVDVAGVQEPKTKTKSGGISRSASARLAAKPEVLHALRALAPMGSGVSFDAKKDYIDVIIASEAFRSTFNQHKKDAGHLYYPADPKNGAPVSYKAGGDGVTAAMAKACAIALTVYGEYTQVLSFNRAALDEEHARVHAEKQAKLPKTSKRGVPISFFTLPSGPSGLHGASKNYPSETSYNKKKAYDQALKDTTGAAKAAAITAEAMALRETWESDVSKPLESIVDELSQHAFDARYCKGVILQSALPMRLKTVMYVGFCDSWNDAVDYLFCHSTEVEVCKSALDWLAISLSQLQRKKASLLASAVGLPARQPEMPKEAAVLAPVRPQAPAVTRDGDYDAELDDLERGLGEVDAVGAEATVDVDGGDGDGDGMNVGNGGAYGGAYGGTGQRNRATANKGVAVAKAAAKKRQEEVLAKARLAGRAAALAASGGSRKRKLAEAGGSGK
ncbi:hypothetical protein PLESTM_000942400 [Pleodorina starrii]|nr:hypothetical protein PLESTM_000942400 [Pleodorina starrii]